MGRSSAMMYAYAFVVKVFQMTADQHEGLKEAAVAEVSNTAIMQMSGSGQRNECVV